MAYTSNKTKQEIVDKVVEVFLKVNTEYGEMDGNTPEFIRERNSGKCAVMFDLLRDLHIQEV